MRILVIIIGLRSRTLREVSDILVREHTSQFIGYLFESYNTYFGLGQQFTEKLYYSMSIALNMYSIDKCFYFVKLFDPTILRVY